jgi:hypothetical protein
MKKGLGRFLVARGCQEKINCLALFVHGAIEIGAFPFDSHLGFIETPTSTHRTLPAAEHFFTLWGVLDDPPIEGGVIHCDSSLAHRLLELPIPNGIGHIPAHAPQKDVRW